MDTTIQLEVKHSYHLRWNSRHHIRRVDSERRARGTSILPLIRPHHEAMSHSYSIYRSGDTSSHPNPSPPNEYVFSDFTLSALNSSPTESVGKAIPRRSERKLKQGVRRVITSYCYSQTRVSVLSVAAIDWVLSSQFTWTMSVLPPSEINPESPLLRGRLCAQLPATRPSLRRCTKVRTHRGHLH